MTKELFIESMKALEEQYDHDIKCDEAFEVILPYSYGRMYDNSKLSTQLVKILRIEMDDNTNESWINYYIDELNFGRKWRPGKVVIAGVKVKLRTPEHLYNLLTRHILQNKE